MIIDAWMQHPNAEWIGNPMFDSLRRWKPGKWSETGQPIEATLAEIDQAGVAVGMLCAWHGPNGVMISNDEVAQHCRAHPGRFIGIASVDLYRPMEAVRELRRRVKQDARPALGLGLAPDDRRYYPVFAECCELDIPFCTQVGHAGPLRESEPGRPIPYLDRVALEKEFNDCAVVLTGTGAVFSAGLDLDHHFALFARRSLKEIDAWFDAYRATNCACSPTRVRPSRRSTDTLMPEA